jgi:hypothetical protein
MSFNTIEKECRPTQLSFRAFVGQFDLGSTCIRSVQAKRRTPMRQNLKRTALAGSAFLFAALFSLGWSEQGGLALSIEKAEARVGRPLTPVSVAGVARRQYRRAAIGTAAVGTAAVGAGYYAGSPYYTDRVRSARAAYYGGYPSGALAVDGGNPHYAVRAYYEGGPWYGYGGWDDYATRNGLKCTPGTMVKLDDGVMHVCQ